MRVTPPICTTAVTDRPTDMMTSLVAMLPKAEKTGDTGCQSSLKNWPNSCFKRLVAPV